MDFVQIVSLSAFLSGRMCPIKRKSGELNLICPAVKAVIELPKKKHSVISMRGIGFITMVSCQGLGLFEAVLQIATDL